MNSRQFPILVLMSNDNIIPCEDCEKLIGGNRHTAPHANLIKTDFKEFPSMFGNVDEHYYKCRVCEKTWMHETGSYGQGWH